MNLTVVNHARIVVVMPTAPFLEETLLLLSVETATGLHPHKSVLPVTDPVTPASVLTEVTFDR